MPSDVARRYGHRVGAGRLIGVRHRRGGVAAPSPKSMAARSMARVPFSIATAKETVCPATGASGAGVIVMVVAASTVTVATASTPPADAVTSAVVVVVSAVRAVPPPQDYDI